MTEFILYIFIASAWIFGINCLFSEGHLLEKTGNWMYDNLPSWIYKPLVGCPACQSSVHGALWFIVGIPVCFLDFLPLTQFVPFLICLCGFNFIILKLTSKERIIKDDSED